MSTAVLTIITISWICEHSAPGLFRLPSRFVIAALSFSAYRYCTPFWPPSCLGAAVKTSLKKKKNLNWQPVLQFCRDVIEFSHWPHLLKPLTCFSSYVFMEDSWGCFAGACMSFPSAAGQNAPGRGWARAAGAHAPPLPILSQSAWVAAFCRGFRRDEQVPLSSPPGGRSRHEWMSSFARSHIASVAVVVISLRPSVL